MLLAISRSAWLRLLGLLPRPLLARLDGWARSQAERRAERRRRALQAARSRS